MNLTITTERIIMRPMIESDLDLVIELFTNPMVMKHIGGPHTTKQVESSFPNYLKRSKDGSVGRWTVYSANNERQIGMACLLPLPTDEEDTNWDLVDDTVSAEYEIEIGYQLKPSDWGQGYATEISSALLQFAFKSTALEEIVAVIDDNHDKSRNVLLKSGFRETGMRTAYGTTCAGFRISKNEWLEKQKATKT